MNNTLAVIGLGKFGYYIVKSLAKIKDFTLIVADNDEHKVQVISKYVENAFVLNSTSKTALEEAGIYNLDTVIVSIGENIEASILTVMALKDLGNKNIIAKAITSVHGEILSKIGAFKVIYPEKIAGKRLVNNLVENITFDEIDLSNTMKVIKFLATKSIIGQSIINIETKDVLAIAHKRNGAWTNKLEDKDIIIEKDDMLAFLGEKKETDIFYNNIMD